VLVFHLDIYYGDVQAIGYINTICWLINNAPSLRWYYAVCEVAEYLLVEVPNAVVIGLVPLSKYLALDHFFPAESVNRLVEYEFIGSTMLLLNC